MSSVQDGPRSPLFFPLSFQVNTTSQPAETGMSAEMTAVLDKAPSGSCVSWGIPFEIGEVAFLETKPVTAEVSPTRATWFVFMHTSDLRPAEPGPGGFISPMRGEGQLGEHAADYVMIYDDGTEARAAIRRRHQIGTFQRRWGENCLQAVAYRKPHPVRAAHEQLKVGWGWTQTRVAQRDSGDWVSWLWAWSNPHPEKAIVRFRFEPVSGCVLLSGIAAGNAKSLPLRWRRRRMVLLKLPEGEMFQPELDEEGLLAQVQLDLGQVISARPRSCYPNEIWPDSRTNRAPEMSAGELLVEYTAHPQACFHLAGEHSIPVVEAEGGGGAGPIRPVEPARQRVTLRVVDFADGRPVAVKLHVHGESGEYLPPVDRHRILNPAWFEDYSVDFAHLDPPWSEDASKQSIHPATYINGETTLDLPQGHVYVEVTKGFEIRPVRRIIEVTPATQEIVIGLEKVLPWRELGWVTADTHVHFLSPVSALLEGAAEGVNVVNLLASQWGELMTNVGDFDGRTTWGSPEAGGDGEYLVRVGTENRQHVLGHISLLGYQGQIIAPMTTGGPDESALGDPIEILLTEWARQCKRQGGLVVLPHFPNPRLENAATLISGQADAIEMTSWGDLYTGIDPYSLSDWYRYLNCGYLVPAVGGTDKMSASMAVGTVRTYARVGRDTPFTYETWMDAVRRGETFVTYGPLLEFSVDGRPMGSRFEMGADGGTVDVTWQVASVTVPASRVELVVNGEIRESAEVSPGGASGHWSLPVDRSCWLALLVRGHYPDKPEMIAAHSSAVMIDVAGSPMLPAADAITILEQIEGALAYLDTVGTRADEAAHKRMRLVLTAAHREFHNRMHQMGIFHEHSPVSSHGD